MVGTSSSTSVDLLSPSSTLTVKSAGNIDGLIIKAPTMNFTAATGIGASGLVQLSSTPTPVVTLSAQTDSGGINLPSLSALLVNQATAGAGVISLSSFNDLTINGNVSTQGAAGVTLASMASLVFNGGVVTTGTGTIMLNPGLVLSIPANETISTGGSITIMPLFGDTTENIAGTVVAGVDVTIDGAPGNTLLGVTGTVAASGNLLIDLTGSTGTAVLLLGGTLGAGGGIAILGSTGAANTFEVGGRLTASTISISAAGDPATSLFDISGALTAPGGASFTSGTGPDVFVVTPSTGAAYTFTFGAITSSLQINTALGNILFATADFTNAATFVGSIPIPPNSIVFVPSTGLKTWTRTAGSVVVTPTAP